jgi:hypothetical protein
MESNRQNRQNRSNRRPPENPPPAEIQWDMH